MDTQLFLIKDFIPLSVAKYAASNKCAITNKRPAKSFTNLVLTLLHVFWITQLFLIKDFIPLSVAKYAASNKCAITNKRPAKSIMQSSILYPIFMFSAS